MPIAGFIWTHEKSLSHFILKIKSVTGILDFTKKNTDPAAIVYPSFSYSCDQRFILHSLLSKENEESYISIPKNDLIHAAAV